MDIVRCLEILQKLLESIVKAGNRLDEGLADYVFFPLSHVFRQSNDLSQRAIELALECLDILLAHGWRKGISKELGFQFLILLTFIAGGRPTRSEATPNEASEELTTIAFKCLANLFQSFRRSPDVPSLTETANLPALGHAVSVMLEGVTNGASSQVQLSASSALSAFHDCIRDKEALASFFPGTVSALTKALQRESRTKRPWRVLEANLKLFSKVLLALLDDVQVSSLVKHGDSQKTTSDFKVPLSESWLKATASQVKIALASVTKLQDHERAEVRHALLQLCEAVLEPCQMSLSECTQLIVNTVIQISAAEPAGEHKEGKNVLSRLVTANDALLDSIKASLHGWVTTLPRVFQSNDDRAKGRTVRQLAVAFDLLSDLGIEPHVVGDIITSTLRDTVSGMIALNSGRGNVIESGEYQESVQDLIHTGKNHNSHSFQPTMIAHRSQQEPLSQLQMLVEQLSESPSAPSIVRDMLDMMQTSSGDQLMASFWLALNMVRKPLSKDSAMEKFIDLGPSSHMWSDVLEELYSYSLSMLLTPWKDQQHDWLLQSLALETVALQAAQLKSGFQTELVEALFPVVHLIDSPHPLLQQHAITCLNIIADCCGYSSAGELVIGNVDYLVNAVALKLNTFDISPQAPQVLKMMIKLAGPALLPYLDDLVDSIFAALDNFHGYPKLVELLFSVLMDIVVEGSKSDALRTGTEVASAHKKRPYRPRTVAEVAEILRDAEQRDEQALKMVQDHEPTDESPRESAPHEPWKSPLSNPDSITQDTTQATGSPPQDAITTTTTTNKHYQLLHSILRLSQHYLTHASPALRRDLLALTNTAAAPLSLNEDLFLPLINELWPVLAKRLLQDSEPFVVVAAADAVAALCRAAGDFMASRVQAEWEAIKRLYAAVETKMRRGRGRRTTTDGKDGGAAGEGGFAPLVPLPPPPTTYTTYTPAYQMWDALVRMLVAVVEHVRIDDTMLDDLLEMWAPYFDERPRLREVLEALNADAVWLELQIRGGGGGGDHGQEGERWIMQRPGQGQGRRLGGDGGGEMDEAEKRREEPRLEGFAFTPLSVLVRMP